MSKNTAVKKREETGLAVASEIDAMFGNSDHMQIPVDAPLPQIKIMRETPVFELPDGETSKELTGHILYYHNANQYYPDKFGEGSEIPACLSSDGIIPDGGEDQQAGPCRDCPFNEYGSAREGNGKACQNTIRLYILIDGDVIPALIKAPPSSLGKKDSLMRWLTNAPNISNKAGLGNAYQPIKVKFSLHRKDFDSGMSASVLDIETIEVLSLKDNMDKISRLASITQEFKKAYLGKVSEYMAKEADNPNTGTEAETSAEDDEEIPI